MPSSSSTPVGVHGRDAGLEPEHGARAWSVACGRSVCDLVARRRPAAPSPRSTRVTWPGRGTAPVAGQRGHELGERTGDLDSGGSATDDDDVERSRRSARSSPGRRSSSAWRWRRSRSASATEYSGKACSAAPGTPKNSAGHPPPPPGAIPRPGRPSARRHAAVRQVDRGDLRRARTSTVGYSRKIAGADGRCPPRAAARSPPGRAAAGTGGSRCGRPASRRRLRHPAVCAHATPASPPPSTTTCAHRGRPHSDISSRQSAG